MTGSEVIPPESEEGDHSEAPKRVAQTVASRKREYRMEAANDESAAEANEDKSQDKNQNQEDSQEEAKGTNKRTNNVLTRKEREMTERRSVEDEEDESKIEEAESMCEAKFLYKPFVPLPNLSDYLNSIIKVVVEADYLTNSNPTIIKRHLWGNDYYSSDSDVVCILQHVGYLKLQEDPPMCKAIEVYLKVSRTRATYTTSYKNGIKSRKTQSFDGHSIRFETARETNDIGNEQQLIKLASQMPNKTKEVRRKQKITHKAKEQDQELSIVFNLSCEPINKFNLGEFGDKRSVNVKVSSTLQREALYIESFTNRYEMSFNKDNLLYQIKEVKNPLLKDLHYMQSKGVPLPAEDVTPIYTDLKWNEIVWSEKSVEFRNSFKISYINGYLYLKYTD